MKFNSNSIIFIYFLINNYRKYELIQKLPFLIRIKNYKFFKKESSRKVELNKKIVNNKYL